MKNLTKKSVIALSLTLLLLWLSAPFAEARFGGGRSSGFRGSRSFGTRQMAPANRNNGFQRNDSTTQQQFGQNRQAASFGGGGMMRGLMGGLAGGLIGSMLFSSFGHANPGGGMFGNAGFGMFEVLLLAGLGFYLYRSITNRRAAAANQQQASASANNFAQAQQPAANLNFDLDTFKDQRTDDFLKFQAAWSNRDLSNVSNKIKPELLQQLDGDISQLKNKRLINRIDHIAVKGSDLIETWNEYGEEFVTLRFRANLVDYTVDETTGNTVNGDKTSPQSFEEDWTFARQSHTDAWKLTAIEA